MLAILFSAGLNTVMDAGVQINVYRKKWHEGILIILVGFMGEISSN